MASEATIRVELDIRNLPLDWRSNPNDFRADVPTIKGPSPGGVLATTAGTILSFGPVAVPGLCRIMNLDPTNFVMLGTWDGAEFTPILDLLPGEFYVVRLSRYLSTDLASPGTSTGTTGSGNQLMLKATHASCNCTVDAFEYF